MDNNINAMVLGFVCPVTAIVTSTKQSLIVNIDFLIALSDIDISFMLQHLTKVPAHFIAGNGDSKKKRE